MSISLLLLLLLSFLLPLASAQHLGLDSFLSSLPSDASNDSFPSLPHHLKLSLSSPSPLRLPSFSLHVPVYIKLVGPSFSPDSPSHLLSFLSASISSSPFHLVSPPSHLLSASHSLHPDVSLSPPSLLSSLSSALRSHLSSSPSPFLRTSLHSVPHRVIDDLIAEEHRRDSSRSSPGYYIYLLDLGPPPKPYAYSYDPPNSGDSANSPPSPAFSRCLGTLFTGADRYLWIDLSAGPVDYGPALSGDGLLPRGEFHPLAAFHTRSQRPERSLLADLASLVLSAYRSLLVPSLRIPIYLETSMLVRFIHIHGSDSTDSGLDLRSVERTIVDAGLLFGDQTLKFDSVKVKYENCPICSFAIAKSTHSFTSRFLFDNYTLIVSEYLDSKRLHQILTDSVELINRAAGISFEEFGRVLPVYVFDLDYDRLLMLDRFHQSVAFRNMVIAVRTRSAQTVSDYSCNGRHVITQTRELERPVIGSILQSMWGVSPTHLSWSPQHNDTLVDYTWSVGQNPFGPFSEITSMSFVQKDAAKRNALLISLNSTITSVVDVLTSMASYGGDRKLLKNNRHVEFMQRWNLMKYKLEKAVSAMSRLDFEKAAFYLRSSDHDLFAIHSLVYQACQELEASLVCFKDPPFPWASASMSVGILLAFVYVYTKREKLFRNKRKKF